jgi:hypothetical protein
MVDWVDECAAMLHLPHKPHPPSSLPPIPITIPPSSNTRAKAEQLCAAWDVILPKLEEPFAEYQLASYAQRPSAISAVLRHKCTTSCGTPVVAVIQCLYISHE